MPEEQKKIKRREKHPGLITQDHKLAALIKKREENKLRNNEQSTEQSSVQSAEQPSVQSTVQSNYVYGIGILAVFVIVVCVFLAYNTFQPKNKKPINEKKDQPKRRHML